MLQRSADILERVKQLYTSPSSEQLNQSATGSRSRVRGGGGGGGNFLSGEFLYNDVSGRRLYDGSSERQLYRQDLSECHLCDVGCVRLGSECRHGT